MLPSAVPLTLTSTSGSISPSSRQLKQWKEIPSREHPLPGLPHPCRWGKGEAGTWEPLPPLRLSAEKARFKQSDKDTLLHGPQAHWKVMWTNTISRRFAQATRCKVGPTPLPNSLQAVQTPVGAEACSSPGSSPSPQLSPPLGTQPPHRPPSQAWGPAHTLVHSHMCTQPRPPFLLKGSLRPVTLSMYTHVRMTCSVSKAFSALQRLRLYKSPTSRTDLSL